jgi:hypothetical protein
MNNYTTFILLIEVLFRKSIVHPFIFSFCTFKKDKKYFIFRKNKDKFDELISKDLEKGLNLCVVSMSSKVAESIYNIYKDRYKCCIHTGNGDDAILDELKNVK